MTEPNETPTAVVAPLPRLVVDHVLSSSTLITGLTGSGKTALLTTFAEWVWETYRKVTLAYVTDGGGIPPQMQALVNRGIVRMWKMRTRSAKGLAFETCQRAAQGWWPRKINPRTGETEANVGLVPSTTERYTMHCPVGHAVKTVLIPTQLGTATNCPECGVLVTPMNMRVERSSVRTKGFESVGAVVFDGLSSMCSWMMDDLSERAGRNELGGEKGALGTIISGDIAIGGTNRAMYGTVQSRAEAMVLNSNGIPNLVVPPVWTALTLETSDEGGLSIRGPLIVGQAKTAVACQWFGDTMEAIVVEHDHKKYRRLMLQQWIDEKGIRHLCGIRSFPGMLPQYLEDEESDDPTQAFRNFNLGTFYKRREEAKQRTEDAYALKYADAPGLPEGESEYGEQAVTVGASPGGLAAAGRPAAPATNAAAVSPAAAAAARAQAAPKAAEGSAAALARVGEGAFSNTPAPGSLSPAAAAAARVAAARGGAQAPPTAAAPTAAAGTPAAPATTPAAASQMATGPIPNAPEPPKPPARGPVAPPPGRRPVK